MKKKDICDAEFFHYEEKAVSFSELTKISGLGADILKELIEIGVFEPEQGESPDSWIFSSYAIIVARKALKLKVDFDLLPAGIAIALTYQEKIRELEKRVKELECQLIK